MIADDEGVAVIMEGDAEGINGEYDNKYVFVYKFKDGKIFSIHEYNSDLLVARQGSIKTSSSQVTKVLKVFYLLTLCLAVGFLNAYTPLENIRVVDGDTIRAEAKGKEIKIRLVEIDAPEMNQPFGAQSKNFLNRLLYEKEVTLIAQGEDRYGRVLGNLFSNELNVNMLMVKFGFAWVYDEYAKKFLFI